MLPGVGTIGIVEGRDIKAGWSFWPSIAMNDSRHRMARKTLSRSTRDLGWVSGLKNSVHWKSSLPHRRSIMQHSAVGKMEQMFYVLLIEYVVLFKKLNNAENHSLTSTRTSDRHHFHHGRKMAPILSLRLLFAY